MARQSLFERHKARIEQSVELAIEHAPAGLAPSPVHVATVEVIGQLLTLGTTLSTPDMPMHLRAMMRTVEKSKPLMLEGILKADPEEIRRFMAALRDKLNQIIDAPDAAGELVAAAPTPEAAYAALTAGEQAALPAGDPPAELGPSESVAIEPTDEQWAEAQLLAGTVVKPSEYREFPDGLVSPQFMAGPEGAAWGAGPESGVDDGPAVRDHLA